MVRDGSDTNVRSVDFVRCCYNCGTFISLSTGSSESWIRSVKRKCQEVVEGGNRFCIPGLDLYSNASILVENECKALRQALNNQQQIIQDLYAELEEERNAASSAANEAMSMILRLQTEKAEIAMEARQFKIFAQEKMAHDQQELLAFEDLLYDKEQTIQALTYELDAYKPGMESYGITEEEIDVETIECSRTPKMVDIEAQNDLSSFSYPPLKCNIYENPCQSADNVEITDIETYPHFESPYECDRLKSLNSTHCRVKRVPSMAQLDGDSSSEKSLLENRAFGQSSRRPIQYRKPFVDGLGLRSSLGTDREANPAVFMESPSSTGSFKRIECVNFNNASDNRDDISDRVYTIDSIHSGMSHSGFDETGPEFYDVYSNSSRYQVSSMNQHRVRDTEIKKLFMRLQDLEADRESLRQTIISMQNDRADLVLLSEMAHRLSKEMNSIRQIPSTQQASLIRTFSIISICKWIVSFIFWRKKARSNGYTYKLPANNMGLLMLLDNDMSCTRRWRCHTSVQA